MIIVEANYKRRLAFWDVVIDGDTRYMQEAIIAAGMMLVNEWKDQLNRALKPKAQTSERKSRAGLLALAFGRRR
jgi:hypothetical protein